MESLYSGTALGIFATGTVPPGVTLDVAYDDTKSADTRGIYMANTVVIAFRFNTVIDTVHSVQVHTEVR